MSRGKEGSSPHSDGFMTVSQGRQTPPPLNNSVKQGSRAGATAFCLGQPSHPVQAEEAICSICGYLVAGANLGVYQILQFLGSGRNGSAYLATHLRSRQLVAIKLFPPDPVCVPLWDAVRREVRVATALRHPSLLSVFSCATWQPETLPAAHDSGHEPVTLFKEHDQFLLTLRQYIPGTLTRFAAHYERNEMQQALHRQGIKPLSHLMKLIEQMGSALSAAHARGIVHGGLTPGNILIDGHERIWIADFGLTRLNPPPPPYLAPELYASSRTSIEAGNMAPFWEAVTPASDQYMLAVLCQRLFSRLLRSVDYEHLLPILQYATNHKPQQRFASVDVFIHELVSQTARGHAYPSKTSSISQTGEARFDSGMRELVFGEKQPPATPAQKEQHDNKVVSPTPVLHSSVDDWEKLGGKLFTKRDYAGATKAYLRALELDAGRPSTWLALGDTYFALEQCKEALEAYDRAVQLNPGDPQVWFNRGTALDALGRYKEARACYERAQNLGA